MPPSKAWRKLSVVLAACIFSAYYILSCTHYQGVEVTNDWNNVSSQGVLGLNMELDTVQMTTGTEDPTKSPTPFCKMSTVRKRSFPNVRLCSNYTTRLCEEGTFNLTALVSYPGSGNTWLRHLIEIATGFFTGSVYFDHTLHARGFLGEKEDWSSGSTIVQKLHVKYNPEQNFKRGILIIREPILATRSFVDYLESGHTGWASPTTFKRKEWPSFLVHSTHDWLALAKSWIEAPGIELLVIHYENLVNSTAAEIVKVLKFLNVSESRLDSECFMKSIEGSFHRRPPMWKINSPTPTKVRRLIDDGVDYLNQLLNEHGKEEIPLERYSCYRNTTGDRCKGIT